METKELRKRKKNVLLNTSERQAVRELVNHGYMKVDIAKKFNVSVSTIDRIVQEGGD
ncbi:helix-turn-helix domain-containing protein [Endozoicomonas sp. SCSIO W0465]|uniref:helix-turn-helix domain-containing protein n=1 Tax=Endozoicomonas sp. SCSIO W0465 TaxID=2918516 RepID=UPI002075BE63|nr:helix-turn-helix domain-containing protein [Endozoicomonas sp. SCSIO W0465]USE39528.1 helix-turn-helix domain-containing protein [Endozoicomonas sp. SCSIO W0465]